MQGINIYSGAGGLGSALTNPTELAYRKGVLKERYPILFRKRRWPDVETAYLTLRGEDHVENERLMVELIAAKFTQHPSLTAQVIEKGGREFLMKCSHFTNARSEHFQWWEGEGMASPFIRLLVAGFDMAQAGSATQDGQVSLF
jgi:hypothetical protein